MNNKVANRIAVFGALLLMAGLLFSCKKDFDEQLMIGKWREGTEYYRYDTGHTGATWDTADDISEDEATTLTWEINGERLMHYHRFSVGEAIVPKSYTLTKLTSSELQYHDGAGTEHNYVKVNE